MAYAPSSDSNDRLTRRTILLAAFICTITLAAVLRLHALDVRAFHADESVASLIALQASNVAGYEYLPVTHGPLPQLATASLFFFAGDSDLTARLLPAICGVLLAAMPLLLRRQIGVPGAIAASLAIAVSPSLLYYSRFAGPDPFLALFSFALAVAAWRYLESAQRHWLYAMAAALALMITTSEMALIIAPIFAAFFAYLAAVDLYGQTLAARVSSDDGRRSHYDALGVSGDASEKTVRQAYRKLIDAASTREERAVLANALGVLTDVNRRAAYDRRLARRRVQDDARAQNDARPIVEMPPALRKAVLFAATPLIVAAWPFIRGRRRRAGLHRLPAAADAMLIITLLALPFYGPLVQMLPFVGDRGFGGEPTTYVIGGVPQTSGGELGVMWLTLGTLFGIAAAVGVAWRWHAFIIAWAAFYGIALTLFTGFFTNRGGVWTGTWGTMDYWFRPEAQIQREPPYYYAMILPLYEFLPLAVAAGGLAFMLLRGPMRDRVTCALAACGIALAVVMPASTPLAGEHREAIALAVAAVAVLALRMPPFTKFLAFWAVSAFFGFTVAGEKQAALAMHIALPLALLSAKLVNDAIVAVRVPSMPRPSFRLLARPRLVQASLAATFAGIAVFSMQSGMLAAWGRGAVPQLRHSLVASDAGDTPVDVLQASQTAPDVAEIRDAIARAGAASGEGDEMVIVIDTSYNFAVPWLWYLRDYRNLQLENLRRPFDVPAGAVVLADARNRPQLGNMGSAATITYTQQWSFPRTSYEGMSAAQVASALLHASSVRAYARDRASIGQLRSFDGVAVFPRELSVALPQWRQSDVLSTNVAPAP